MANTPNRIHVGDIGTSLVLEIKDEADVLISQQDATTAEIWLKPPRGAITRVKTAVLDPVDDSGKIAYVTVADDIDLPGVWEMQGYVVLPGGEWHSSSSSFTVEENL